MTQQSSNYEGNVLEEQAGGCHGTHTPWHLIPLHPIPKTSQQYAALPVCCGCVHTHADSIPDPQNQWLRLSLRSVGHLTCPWEQE